jgi:predicted permease
VRTALVVAEVALSMMLLVGAGLLGVSLKRVLDVSPGFQPDGLLTAQLALPASKYPDRVRMAAFYERLLERIQQLPSVVSAGATTALPFGAGGSRASFQIEGRANPGPTPNRAQIRVVTPGYLETLRVPLVRGRLIDDRDRDRTQPVAVVNNETARRYWPGEDPLGRRISFSFVGAGDTEWLEIVGIVGDMRHAGLEAAFEPEVYVPILQARLFPTLGSFAILTVRGAGDLAQIAPEVQTAVFGVDADQPLDNVQSMESLIERSVAPRRLNVWLLIAFATTAVLLAATGLYGVMACLVTEQTQEIGVRMALGASPLSVLGLVVRQAGTMTLAGVATGLAAAWALSRYLATLLFGVSATDPVVYALVALALLAVAMLAVALPAIRATRIDPLRAIRA